MPVTFYSTNNKNHRVNFQTALLKGLAPDYGLYTLGREDVPKLSIETILAMKELPYSEISFEVLSPFLKDEIPANDLKVLLYDAYNNKKIPTKVQHIDGKVSIMWLTQGPTYSFKDYAARFFARALNYFFGKKGLRRTVVVATSGDTGGAVAAALHDLDNVDNIVFYPRGAVSEGQRRQMTTLQGNVYAFEVNGDFDVCQALAKSILNDKAFAEKVFGDCERLTSANSISVGRLLPQAVYPFFAYSRVAEKNEPMIASIPSGNFGDMMGTVIAKQMGLPVSKIICGVNENTEFPDFLKTCQFHVAPSIKCPSSAMIVSNPSNLARLVDFYGGHIFDERDEKTNKVICEGKITKLPDMKELCGDIFSVSVTNPEHYSTMKKVYDKYGVILDPHGAVGWKALEEYLGGKTNKLSVVYETVDPGKFPIDVKKAIGIEPEVPAGMKKQFSLKERVYSIESPSNKTAEGLKLSGAQLAEAKEEISAIFSAPWYLLTVL